jgi:hypothetical protein
MASTRSADITSRWPGAPRNGSRSAGRDVTASRHLKVSVTSRPATKWSGIERDLESGRRFRARVRNERGRVGEKRTGEPGRDDGPLQRLRHPSFRIEVADEPVEAGARHGELDPERAVRAELRMNVIEMRQVARHDEQVEQPLVNGFELAHERSLIGDAEGQRDRPRFASTCDADIEAVLRKRTSVHRRQRHAAAMADRPLRGAHVRMHGTPVGGRGLASCDNRDQQDDEEDATENGHHEDLRGFTEPAFPSRAAPTPHQRFADRNGSRTPGG